MSMACLLQNTPEPRQIDIEECLDGNLCRCTGYRSIIAAGNLFAKDFSSEDPTYITMYEDIQRKWKSFESNLGALFPSDLKTEAPSLRIKGENSVWFQPTSLEELLSLKSEHPYSSLLAGLTSYHGEEPWYVNCS